MKKKPIRNRTLSSRQNWFLVGYRWAVPFVIAVAAEQMLRFWGTPVTWSKLPVFGVLLVFWLLTLLRPRLAMGIDVLVMSLVAWVSVAQGAILLLDPDPSLGATLLREVAFWTPVICAYWAMLLHPRPWLMVGLVASFNATLILADFYIRSLNGSSITQGTPLQMIALAIILVIMVRIFGAVHTTVTDERNRARHKALRDGLTGLYNRLAFEYELRRSIKLAQRHRLLFSLVVLDIDFFKHFNDRFGHLAGDGVLQMVARVLRRNLRQSDLLCRWGGEEFAIILPETSVTEACEIADKIRRRVASQPSSTGKQVTVSCGVATYIEKDQPHTLFDRADAALLRAKEGGRNQVVCSDEQCPTLQVVDTQT